MATTETIREIQTLVAGRNAAPATSAAIAAPNGQPNGDVGFEVKNTVNAFVGVKLQAVAGRIAARINIVDVVEDAVFEIDFNSIGATTYTALAEDDSVSVAAALVAAAGSAYSAVGTLSATADGAVVMLGVDNTPYVVFAEGTLGGTVEVAVEASSVIWRRWYRIKGSADWFETMDSERTDIRNVNERHIVAGLDRFYIEIVTTNGTVVPAFAPCLPE